MGVGGPSGTDMGLVERATKLYGEFNAQISILRVFRDHPGDFQELESIAAELLTLIQTAATGDATSLTEDALVNMELRANAALTNARLNSRLATAQVLTERLRKGRDVTRSRTQRLEALTGEWETLHAEIVALRIEGGCPKRLQDRESLQEEIFQMMLELLQKGPIGRDG